jgi:hypothetical protein
MRRWLAIGIGVALAVSFGAGCNRQRARVAQPFARELARPVQWAATHGGCMQVDQVLYVRPDVIQIRGCGRRTEYFLPGGRHEPVAVGAIETRAAAELHCDASSLRVASPAPAVRGVSGCGRRARYDLQCDAHGCGWMMTAHAGRWAGLETAIEVPDQFDVAWPLPPEVGPSARTAPRPNTPTDLDAVALPPPPGTAPPPPPSPEVIVPPSGDAAIPPPPGP